VCHLRLLNEAGGSHALGCSVRFPRSKPPTGGSIVSPERWHRVNELFEAAAVIGPASRAGFLDQACGSDVELRDQVAQLLANDARAAQFLHHPTRQSALPENEASSVVTIDHRIGAYRLTRQIAAGGMGSVWLAERDDDQFHNRVAVKLLHRGMDSDEIL